MACAMLAIPAVASAQSGGASAGSPVASDRSTSESASDDSESSSPTPTTRARIVDGEAVAPSNAPAAVKSAIAAANRIAQMPYRYGGGHAKVEDTGYDCSGAISYALINAKLLKSPLASGPFMSWGEPGPGKWITVYAHSGHAYVMIAGLRFDTGWRGRESALVGTAPGKGPRWGYARPTSGFTARHPAGL